MFGNKSKNGVRSEADDGRLRYHLTSLYTLQPVPDDLLALAREIGSRVEGARPANDGD